MISYSSSSFLRIHQNIPQYKVLLPTQRASRVSSYEIFEPYKQYQSRSNIHMLHKHSK